MGTKGDGSLFRGEETLSDTVDTEERAESGT